ncbi:MAG: DUF2235 domain-containing protein [Candidatus Marinimicrobia bacterium]|nr:DUF2235 domain-containing protein [Candidatus Neomarinimicrobiota bacterium]
MAKNIVIFSDGTGQEGGKGTNSNVYKLFNMIEDRTDRQVAFYDRGLGTGWRKLTGKAFGAGISKNIRDCYRFLFDHFQSGDKVYLLGFSRGAFTVRSLSGFINMFGILPKSRPELIKQAYRIYKKSQGARRDKLAADFLARHHNMWCEIEFLGVWDTVKALGSPIKLANIIIPKKNEFHDATISPSVVYGAHALAIDDLRKNFHPTFWDEREAEPGQIKQVWFAGMHSDVGGGYADAGLSDFALRWMIDQGKSRGLLIWDNRDKAVKGDSTGKLHDSRAGWGRMYPKKERRLTEEIIKPVLHQSVIDRHNNEDMAYDPWIFKVNGGYDIEP